MPVVVEIQSENLATIPQLLCSGVVSKQGLAALEVTEHDIELVAVEQPDTIAAAAHFRHGCFRHGVGEERQR